MPRLHRSFGRVSNKAAEEFLKQGKKNRKLTDFFTFSEISGIEPSKKPALLGRLKATKDPKKIKEIVAATRQEIRNFQSWPSQKKKR